ncbi:MAG: zinc ribbon domain-containing protein [Kiritimatiellia bacterium]
MSPRSKKEVMVSCPGCGAENRIASAFCKACGGRIYKDGAVPPPATSKKNTGAGLAIRNAFKSLLFICIVAAVGLAFWPYSALSVPQGTDDSKQVERYLAIAEDALDKETPIAEARFSERNLNAYLGRNSDPDASLLLGAILNSPRVLVIANEPVGPFHLSTRVVLDPAEDGAGYEVTDLWVGHLPLPTLWAKPWTISLAKRFELKVDPRMWDHLRILRVESSHVTVELDL